MKQHFFFFIVFLSLWSCGTDSKRAAMILQSVENVVEQFPDSALLFLDSIGNPYELNRKQHAKYMLLLVQAKYKSYQDISTDTLIFQATDYFQETNDTKRLALAKFYSGRVLESIQKPKEALEALLEAESIAISLQDKSIIGFIQYNTGDAFFGSGLYDEAIHKYRQASENFACQKSDYAKMIMSLCNIGSCFVIKNKVDSALLYYNEALLKATVLNDSTNRAGILQNMGFAFLESGKMDEAKEQLMEAQKFSKDPVQQAKINLNLAKIYSEKNLLDSATLYLSHSIESAQKTDDKSLQASVFYYSSQIDEKKGDYKAGLENYKIYADIAFAIYDEGQMLNFLDVQKKYDFELIRQANNKLLIEKQRILIFSLAVVLFFFIFAFFVFRKKKQDEAVILFAKQEIYQLKEIINNSSNRMHSAENEKNTAFETNDRLRETLAKQFGILNRIALLEDTLSIDEKEKGKAVLKRVYGIMYGHSERYDWNVLIHTVNDLYEGYADKLCTIAPQLKEIEYRVCCLSKAGLNSSEIASLLNTSENAIHLRKTHIRKVLKMQGKKNFVMELDKLVANHN